MSLVTPLVQDNTVFNYMALQPVYQQPYQEQPQTYQPIQVQGTSYVNRKDNETAALLLIFGFFYPIVWIVNLIMYLQSKNKDAQKLAKLSIIMFIANMFVYLLIVV
ncbi:hypothetical protein QTN25_002956 [Entamoeba marina]